MSKNRLNPLDEAHDLGESLSMSDVGEVTARMVISEFAHRIYWKDRANPYRTRWIDSAVRGYLSMQKEKREFEKFNEEFNKGL